ncbi:MAG: hypothetical protein NVSMB68_05920 [Thermoanaerobaculia bacterium]
MHLIDLVRANEKTSILVVDDDAPIRKLLERVAMRAGFDVDCARDGFEALQMLQAKEYSIAIIDLMMPRVSGYELVQKISAMNPRPVIIVATATTNADVAKIDDTLVRRIIRKPFDVRVVSDTLIETALDVEQRKQAAEKRLRPAPSDTGTVRVSAEDLVRQINEETASKKEADEPEANLPKGDQPN